MSRANSKYKASARQGEQVRVVAVLAGDLVARVDDWGVPAGMPSRTAALRHLIEKGLENISPGQSQNSNSREGVTA